MLAENQEAIPNAHIYTWSAINDDDDDFADGAMKDGDDSIGKEDRPSPVLEELAALSKDELIQRLAEANERLKDRDRGNTISS